MPRQSAKPRPNKNENGQYNHAPTRQIEKIAKIVEIFAFMVEANIDAGNAVERPFARMAD
jgi:hypothetical protein